MAVIAGWILWGWVSQCCVVVESCVVCREMDCDGMSDEVLFGGWVFV
jgi:hydrogenase maturation factor